MTRETRDNAFSPFVAFTRADSGLSASFRSGQFRRAMKPHALSSVPEVLYSPDQARNDEQRVHTDADKVRALIITEDHACAFKSRRGERRRTCRITGIPCSMPQDAVELAGSSCPAREGDERQ